MTKKKQTDFYLLKQKSIHEGDLFVTDYIKTRQRLVRIEDKLEILKLRLNKLKNDKKKIIKIYEKK